MKRGACTVDPRVCSSHTVTARLPGKADCESMRQSNVYNPPTHILTPGDLSWSPVTCTGPGGRGNLQEGRALAPLVLKGESQGMPLLTRDPGTPSIIKLRGRTGILRQLSPIIN